MKSKVHKKKSALLVCSLPRWLIATIIVLVLVAAVVVSGVLESSGTQTNNNHASEQANAAVSFDAILGNADSTFDAAAAELPETVTDELPRLLERDELKADVNSGIVGFTQDGDAGAVLDEFAYEMHDLGWTVLIKSDNYEGTACATGSFCKKDGVLKWAVVTCTAVDNKTSVVVQYS